jgi:1-acyl-sn-glycerol-3-phosphate acyltransferase
MRILSFLYTSWAVVCFVVLYLLIFPIQYICLQREDWKPFAHKLNRWFVKAFFPAIGMPVEVQYDYVPATRGTYIFAANHFSYLDVPVMGVILDNYFAFVGKSSVKHIPALGYMFAKLHIQVDRADVSSRTKSIKKSLITLQQGRSIVIYPEGGIRATNPPQMALPLKDGAFAMAIQQQVPLVPISLLNVYKRLPDNGKTPQLHAGKIKAIVHKPISTIGMTSADIPALKEQFYNLVQDTLNSSVK